MVHPEALIHDTYEFFLKGIPFLAIALFLFLIFYNTLLGAREQRRDTGARFEGLTWSMVIVMPMVCLYFFSLGRTYIGLGPMPANWYDLLRFVGGYSALLGMGYLVRYAYGHTRVEWDHQHRRAEYWLGWLRCWIGRRIVPWLRGDACDR